MLFFITYKVLQRNDCLYKTPLIIHAFLNLSKSTNLLENLSAAIRKSRVQAELFASKVCLIRGEREPSLLLPSYAWSEVSKKTQRQAVTLIFVAFANNFS